MRITNGFSGVDLPWKNLLANISYIGFICLSTSSRSSEQIANSELLASCNWKFELKKFAILITSPD